MSDPIVEFYDRLIAVLGHLRQIELSAEALLNLDVTLNEMTGDIAHIAGMAHRWKTYVEAQERIARPPITEDTDE